MSWEGFIANAEFAPRDTAHGFVRGGRLYLSGGWATGGTTYRDLWHSLDGGATWQCVNAATPYDAYSGMALLGSDVYAANRTCWRSTTAGATWTKLGDTPIPSTATGSLPYLRNYNSRLYLFWTEGLWSSADGVTWQAEPLPPELKRGSYGVVEYKGALWLMGGATYVANSPPEKGYPGRTSYNDVWRFDGAWTRITDNAGWAPRMWPGIIVHNDMLYIVGGYDNRNDINLDDTWKSQDGLNWHKNNLAKKFTARHWPTMFSRGSDIILVAGNAWPTQNDIWRLRLP